LAICGFAIFPFCNFRRAAEKFFDGPDTIGFSTADELPVIRAHYEYMLLLQPQVSRFPRDLRHSLGRQIEDLLHAILRNLIRARYSRERRSILESVNIDLEVLRFELRFAKDQRCLAIRNYGTLTERLLEIGRQVGGWMKA
jgi:hypothetical protein